MTIANGYGIRMLEEHIARRRAINQLYRTLLHDLPGMTFHTNPDSDFNSNYWLTCIVIDPQEAGFTREELRLKMEEENIETRPLWKPMHLQPVFADCPYYGDNTEERLFDNGLCLPSGPTLTDKDIERVAGVIREMY